MRNLALVVLLLTAPLAADITRMECGVVYDGRLDAETSVAIHGFTAESGDAIAVRAISTSADRAFTVRASLVDPSGTQVQTRKTSAFGSNGGEFELTAAGEYTIQISAGSSVKTGTYRIIRTSLKGPCASTGLTCGAVSQGRIGGVLAVNSYQVVGQPGDVVSFRLAKTTRETSEEQAAVFALVLYDPAGRMATSVDGEVAARASTTGVRLDARLEQRGTYTVLAFEISTGARMGAYAVVYTRLNGGCRATPAPCGTAVDASIAEAATVHAYTFTAAAGDAFLLRRMRTDGTLRLLTEVYDPAGEFVPPTASSDASRYAFTGKTAGTYTVLVSDDINYTGTLTGSYSIAFARLNNPCNAQPLACGGVTDGRIDGPVRLVGYAVTAEAGDVYLLRLMRTETNTGFRPRLEIYDPAGNLLQLTSALDSSRVVLNAAAAGTYAILATDGQDGTRTGAYSVSLARLNRPCNATALACGAPVEGSAGGLLRFSTYSYTAGAGDSFTVRLLDPAGDLQGSVEVYDPLGNPAGTAVPGNLPGVDVARPAAGTYTILAMSAARMGGPAPLAMQFFRTREACAAPLERGVAQNGVITGPAPFNAYTLSAAAGDALLVRSASFTAGFTPNMDLYDPQGVRVVSGTFSQSAAASAGNYMVIVGASAPRGTGRYALSWQALNNPSGSAALPCGQTVSAGLSAAAPFRYYTAAAEAGDLLKVLLTRVSDGFTPQVELYDPAGRRLAAASGEISRRVTEGGNYVVLVGPATATGETGVYSLAFQKPNNPCLAKPLSCGQTVLGSAALPGQLDAYRFEARAGERTVLRIPSRFGAFSPFVEVYDAAGTLVHSAATSLVSRVLPSTGAFTLLVRDRAGVNTGTYRVSLQRDPDACPVDDKEAPVIRLRRPTGGEVAAGGSMFRIAWESDDNIDVTAHEILLSTDGGATFPTTVATELGGTAQSHDWPVPATITPTRNARIRVTATDAAGNSTSATSDLLSIIGSGFPENSAVTYEYDALNRVVRAAYANGTVAEYVYDPAGNLVRVSGRKP